MSDCTCDDIIIEMTEEGLDGNGIVGISLISTVDKVKTYRITFTNGTYFDYAVTDGANIESIEKTATVGLVDTYTVTLSDGSTTTFEVTNGNGIASITTFEVTNGNGIASITKTGQNVLTDIYTVTFTNGTTTTFEVTNGRSISNVAKTGTSGLVDTYTVTYNDGTTSTFDVTNGMPATHAWNGTVLTVTSASGTSSADLKGDTGEVTYVLFQIDAETGQLQMNVNPSYVGPTFQLNNGYLEVYN